MICAKCGVTLKPTFDGHPLRRSDDWTVQYDDALPMTFRGGYGMYADPMDELVSAWPERNHTAIICKDCADSLLDANPWMKRFVDYHLEPCGACGHPQFHHTPGDQPCLDCSACKDFVGAGVPVA